MDWRGWWAGVQMRGAHGSTVALKSLSTACGVLSYIKTSAGGASRLRAALSALMQAPSSMLASPHLSLDLQARSGSQTEFSAKVRKQAWQPAISSSGRVLSWVHHCGQPLL